MPRNNQPLSTRWALGSASVALLATVAVAFTVGLLSDDASPQATGLVRPRGLTPLEDGGMLVAEVGAGRLLRLGPEGALDVIHTGIPHTLDAGPGGSYPSGISAAVFVDGAYYYVVGEYWVPGYSELYRLEPGATPEPLTGQEIVNRFPTNPLTNPYDTVPAPQGGFFVSDSGRNAVFHITMSGSISEYAAFPRRDSPLQDGPKQMDVVPTGLTLGPDGALYLASLTGYPYPKGEAYVYRLEDSNGDGDASDEGEVTVFARGFTAATDVVFEEDGTLVVTEFTSDMSQLIQMGGVDMAAQLPGRLVRWREGILHTIAEGLVSPTSVAIADDRTMVSEEFANRVSLVRSTSLLSRSLEAWPQAIAAGLVVGMVSLTGGLLIRRRGLLPQRRSIA